MQTNMVIETLSKDFQLIQSYFYTMFGKMEKKMDGNKNKKEMKEIVFAKENFLSISLPFYLFTSLFL